MSRVNAVSGAQGAPSERGGAEDIALIAQKGTLGELTRGDPGAFAQASKRAPATAPQVPERLKAIPDGEGDVGLRDKNGNTLATTLKAREVYRDGRWRNEGFVAERMSAYSATSRGGQAQPEANGYGYFQAEHGKMRLITGRDGRVITELTQARARAGAMMRHGGLTMTTDAQAQTAQTAKEQRRQSLRGITHNDDGSLRKTTLTQWKPVIPLPKPIEQMQPVDRLKYMVAVAIRFAPAAAKNELQALATPQNLAAMAAFAAAQFVPGVNVAADGLAIALLGKDVTESGVKFIEALHKAVTAGSAHELEDSGRELAEVGAHLPATALGLMGVKPLAKSLGKNMTPPAAWAPAKVLPPLRASALPSRSSAGSGIERFQRRPGESMSDYLARQNVPQSLTPQQQRSLDKNRMRMSATPPPSGRIDKSAARAKVQTLDARETTLLRGLHEGEQGAAIARAQGWSTQQFVAVRNSALHKLGVKDARAAIKVAEAGGVLSTQAALPPEVAQATAQYDQTAWRETILAEPSFSGVHLPPAQKQLFFTWIDNKMDLQGTVAALGKPAASTRVMLNKLAHRFGLSVDEMKAAVREHVAFAKAEAPATWPEAARQRFAFLRDNATVQRAQLTPRDIQLLSFWTHSAFNRGEAASVLGLTAESMSVRLGRLSQALGFETGATGQRGFKQFLTETTAPRRGSAAKADAGSLLPPRGARYGNLNLSMGGLARSLPGLNVNPLRSGTNCIDAAVALDRQRGGAPASALALERTNPADLNTLYGRLPEQGFSAKVNGRYLLPPKTRFDMASMQRYVGSLPNGARGILLVNYRMLESGHALVVENVNGRAMFIDGQSGLVLEPKAISSGAMVLPALAGSTKAAGRSLAELPDIHYMFLRTDDVSRLNALPKGTRQGIVVAAESGNQRVRVADPTGVRSDEWVDVSNAPGSPPRMRLGENVYVVDDASAGTTSRKRIVPQSAGWAR
jgi:hypothetical protein